MVTLTPSNGCILLKKDAGKNLPFGLGVLIPVYDEAAEKMGLINIYNIGAPEVNMQSYTDYKNGLTGLAFGSYDALLEFVANYMFNRGVSNAVLSGVPVNIVAVPVGSNDVEPGATIDISGITDATNFPIMIVTPTGGGQAVVYVSGIHYEVAAGVVSWLNGSTFLDGDRLVFVTQY